MPKSHRVGSLFSVVHQGIEQGGSTGCCQRTTHVAMQRPLCGLALSVLGLLLDLLSLTSALEMGFWALQKDNEELRTPMCRPGVAMAAVLQYRLLEPATSMFGF